MARTAFIKRYNPDHVDIFLPTSNTVKEDYTNGLKGDPLWEQMKNGILTGNFWSLKEINSIEAKPHAMLTEFINS